MHSLILRFLGLPMTIKTNILGLPMTIEINILKQKAEFLFQDKM